MTPRVKTAVRATLAAAVMMMLVAPAAHAAISNPAAHPNVITVVIDGVEYTDGQDTLPGYDDESCGPIPGAEVDFDENRVYYKTDHGEKSIAWTEWDRIQGYGDWLKKQQAAPVSSDTTTENTAASQTTGKTTSGSASAETSSGSKTSNTTSQSLSSSGTQAANTSIVDDASSPEPAVSASTAGPEELTASASPAAARLAATSTDAGEPVAEAAPITASNQSGLGRILLIVLFGAGVATFVVYEILRRRSHRERA